MINWQYLWDKFVYQVFTLGGYKTILDGLFNTLVITFGGFAIGLVLGAVLAIAQLLPTNKISNVFKVISKTYVMIFRGTPIVVQLLVGWYVLRPMLGIRTGNPLIWGTVIFGLNSGAYMSEIMRGGLMSVDRGQMEAGRSLGLPYFTTLFKVVVPQALKNSFPSIGNELISLIKETSVAGFISVVDLQVAFKLQDTIYNPIICYIALALVYVVLVALFTLIVRLIERRLRKSDKH